MHTKPSPEQFKYLKTLPRDQPICMLNLVRLRPMASYTGSLPRGPAESFLRYSQLSAVGG